MGHLNLMVSIGISYLLLFVSIFNFNKNIEEVWCLIVAGIHFINLFMENILNIILYLHMCKCIYIHKYSFNFYYFM